MNNLCENDEIELNNYIKSIRVNSLTTTELILLLKSPKMEDKQRFIHGYLPRVVNYAINIYDRLSQYFDLPYSIMDFIQEGNEALTKLVYEGRCQNHDLIIFNWLFYIMFKRNLIKNLFPLSERIIEKYIDFIEMYDSYIQQNDYNISFEEFGSLCGLSIEQVKTLKNCFIQNQPLNYSLDEIKIIGGSVSVDEAVYYLMMRDTILETLDKACLSDREKEIIIRYFGINAYGYNNYGLETNIRDLACEYVLSRQRVYQLFNQGLGKIRNNEGAMEKLSLCRRI